MRRIWVTGFAICGLLIASSTAVVLAAQNQVSDELNAQALAWVDSELSMSAEGWRDVRGLTISTGCFHGPVASAILSVQLAAGSAPALFRIARRGISVINNDPHSMQPGAIKVHTPDRTPRTTTFTFAQRRNLDGHGDIYQVQWRSPSGRQVTLNKGTLKVDWTNNHREGANCM